MPLPPKHDRTKKIAEIYKKKYKGGHPSKYPRVLQKTKATKYKRKSELL